MQKILLLTLFIPFAGMHAFAGYSDTTILGVSLYFKTPAATAFSKEWQNPPINATAKLIAGSEIGRSQAIMSLAIGKYPLPLLISNCKAAYFFRSMTLYSVDFGGTNSTDVIYVSNNGAAMGYTDLYVEQNIHHELSSIFLRNYTKFLDTIAWKKVNMPGFRYKDPEGGVGAIRSNHSSLTLDKELAAKGFLTEYASSDLENDFNTIAQYLFRPTPGFWDIVDTYTRIYKKVTLLIAFYHKLSPQFTEQYFRQFNK